MKVKKAVTTIVLVLVLAGGTGALISYKVKTLVKELFKLNKELQEEGYYMGDFEFKMIGFGYYLDKGNYFKSFKKLSDYHAQLCKKEHLIKIPRFENNQDEINFYLNLQNPETGAFIDDSVPYCTYWEVTQNVINHLEALNDSTAIPLKLKYPLKFLDDINTPQKLTAFLEDVSYVGWLASKFPQTPFHFARNILNEANAESTLERTNLYSFSPEWKQTMLKWMYEFQDTTTGLWGPKNRKTNELLKLDLNNTASILKSFRDNNGNDLYKEFPLKYTEKIFISAIEQLSESYPDEDDLDEIHEWNLRQSKGINMLLRYLWKDGSDENRKNAKEIIVRYIDICFEKYYVKEEGAFSYYPNARHASPDGNVSIFSGIGAFSYEKQKKLWGEPAKNTIDLGEINLKELSRSDFSSFEKFQDINSIRIYNKEPDFEYLTESVWVVYYPNDTQVMDVMELVPNILKWAETSSFSMGNWTSMADIKNEYSKLNICKPLIFRNKFPFAEINREFEKSKDLYAVGFDKLQIPRCRIHYKFLE